MSNDDNMMDDNYDNDNIVVTWWWKKRTNIIFFRDRITSSSTFFNFLVHVPFLVRSFVSSENLVAKRAYLCMLLLLGVAWKLGDVLLLLHNNFSFLRVEMNRNLASEYFKHIYFQVPRCCWIFMPFLSAPQIIMLCGLKFFPDTS